MATSTGNSSTRATDVSVKTWAEPSSGAWHAPWASMHFRGLIERTTDTPVISAEVEHRRDLDTLTDMLGYLRSLKMAGEELEHQVPPRPQHIYARARTRRPLRTALRSSWVDFTTPQAGEHLIPDFDKHLRNTSAPWSIAACQVAALESFIDADNMFSARAPEGASSHRSPRSPRQRSHPGYLGDTCQLSPVGGYYISNVLPNK
jgi:hypothetical protein